MSFNYNKGPLYDGGSPRDWAQSAHEFGVHLAETTQRFIPGARYIRWDGSVFKYGKLRATSRPSRGIFNGSGKVDISGDYGTVTAGKSSVTFTLGANEGYGDGGVDKDELVGGFLIVGHGESREQCRLIVGNNAAVHTTGSLTIVVDGPFTNTLDDSTPWTEVMLNPYNYLDIDLGDTAACVGVPCIIAITGNYIWIQSWGPCYMDAHYQIGNGAKERSVYVQSNGSVLDGSQTTITDGQQMIGHLLDQSVGGVVPFVMLQISI